jgi:hypothetical protein
VLGQGTLWEADGTQREGGLAWTCGINNKGSRKKAEFSRFVLRVFQPQTQCALDL